MQSVMEVNLTKAIDLGALLDAGDSATVTLVAGDTRLLAHRAVLAARCPAVAAMTHHETRESSSDQVTIPDVGGPVLRLLLAFLYTLQVPQRPDMAADLLAAADKYGVCALKAHCEQQLLAQLDVETAAASAVVAVRHSCPSLREAAIALIRAHTHQVMATQGWYDALVNHPHTAVELSRLIAERTMESASSPAAGGSSLPASSHGQPSSSHSRTPDSAATPHSDLPCGAEHCHMRVVSADDKSSRLIQAAEQGTVEDLHRLLADGADVEARGQYRRTALHVAAYEGHVEAARFLLASGAQVEARDSGQETPLHLAVYGGHVAVVRLLLAAAANPNSKDMWGNTPLHDAALRGNSEVAAALLEAGASRGARSNSGHSPLDVARKHSRQQLIGMLS